MAQQGTTEAHADAAPVVGATTEFEPDVVDLLVETLRRAVRRELPAVGTDTLLGELVMGDTEAGAAIAPGIRKAGALSGMINGRAGLGWVSDDEAPGAPVSAGTDAEAGRGTDTETGRETDAEAGRETDEREVDAVWREARWRFGLGARATAAPSGRVLPGMTGAMRACLLLALGSAREEGTISVRVRHVARALVDLPDSRAREALLLRRLDPAAAATALDGPDAGAEAETEGQESRGVTLLRRAGTLDNSGNRLTRALASWTSGTAVNDSPVLFAVSVEAVRQAVRRGRAAAEPVDLLLGILAMDRALSVAGRSLPASLTAANAAAALMRRHGVRQDSLVSAASVPSASAIPSAAVARSERGVRLSAAADRAVAVARLSAAEHGSPSVGTVHLLSALLDEPTRDADAGDVDAGDVDAETDAGDLAADAGDTDAGDGDAVVRLLAAGQVDVAALRAELRLRRGAGRPGPAA